MSAIEPLEESKIEHLEDLPIMKLIPKLQLSALTEKAKENDQKLLIKPEEMSFDDLERDQPQEKPIEVKANMGFNIMHRLEYAPHRCGFDDKNLI